MRDSKLIKGGFKAATSEGRESFWCYWHEDDHKQLFPIALRLDYHHSGVGLYSALFNISHAKSGLKISKWTEDIDSVIQGIEKLLHIYDTHPDFAEQIDHLQTQGDLQALSNEVQEQIREIHQSIGDFSGIET